MSKVIHLTDRTTIETDWTCGKKRQWYKQHGGKGIVPVVEASYYKQGREIHADYAAIMTGADPDAIVRRVIGDVLALQPFPTQADLEQAWWHAGMVVAFATYIAPKWLEAYDVWLVEKELVLSRPPLEIACTVDLALKSKLGRPDRRIVVDYKSVRWMTSGWASHWPYAVQMLINPKAVEETYEEMVDATYVMGIQKGQWRGGVLRHAYTYAYATEDGSKWEMGWHKVPFYVRPLWERSVGLEGHVAAIREWVLKLGEAVAIDLHPMSAPILPNDRMLNQMIVERQVREIEIAAGIARFDSNFSECRPTIGGDCPYLAACHNAEVNADPIGSGLYVIRTPHHDLEWLTKESE